MKKYIKNYIEHHGIAEDEVILCEVCKAVAVDIHHCVDRSDEVDNLMASCRQHHEQAHAMKKPKDKQDLINKLKQ